VLGGNIQSRLPLMQVINILTIGEEGGPGKVGGC
jgi:hypothetical protein